MIKTPRRILQLPFSGIYVKNRTWNNLKYWLYKLHHNRYAITTFRDFSLELDMQDNDIARDLLLIGGREFYSTSYLGSILTKDDIVYDIGANIGYYAIQECICSKFVVAIEPVPSTYDRLLRNIRFNNLINIETYMLAAGDKDGTGTMNVCDRSNWSSFSKMDYMNITDKIIVPIITIDNLVSKTNKQPTFIRMDVEGYEYLILMGARETIKTAEQLKLFIEMHPANFSSQQQVVEMLSYLKASGFEIRKLFLEPEPWNYNDHRLLNWFGKAFDYPGYGEHPPTYDNLINLLLQRGFVVEVFLEKDET